MEIVWENLSVNVTGIAGDLDFCSFVLGWYFIYIETCPDKAAVFFLNSTVNMSRWTYSLVANMIVHSWVVNNSTIIIIDDKDTPTPLFRSSFWRIKSIKIFDWIEAFVWENLSKIAEINFDQPPCSPDFAPFEFSHFRH